MSGHDAWFLAHVKQIWLLEQRYLLLDYALDTVTTVTITYVSAYYMDVGTWLFVARLWSQSYQNSYNNMNVCCD